MLKIHLKELLKKRGNTMSELANETGISMSTLSILGRGESKGIQFDTLEKICTFLSVTPSDLLVVEPDKYVVMVPSQKKFGEDFGVIRASAVKQTVLDEAKKNNVMYSADNNEYNFLVTYLGTTKHNDLSQFFVGLPIETDFAASTSLQKGDLVKTKAWLSSLQKSQVEDIAKQSVEIFLQNYMNRPFPDKAYVAINYGKKASPIYPFWVGKKSGSLIPLEYGKPRPLNKDTAK